MRVYSYSYYLNNPLKYNVMDLKPGDFHILHLILVNIDKLRCDMYDNSLLPIAIVNKLVSLSNHPSAVPLEILQKPQYKLLII